MELKADKARLNDRALAEIETFYNDQSVFREMKICIGVIKFNRIPNIGIKKMNRKRTNSSM